MTNKDIFIGFKIEPETMEMVKKILDATGCTISEHMRQLVRENLEKYNLIKEKIVGCS